MNFEMVRRRVLRLSLGVDDFTLKCLVSWFSISSCKYSPVLSKTGINGSVCESPLLVSMMPVP